MNKLKHYIRKLLSYISEPTFNMIDFITIAYSLVYLAEYMYVVAAFTFVIGIIVSVVIQAKYGDYNK